MRRHRKVYSCHRRAHEKKTNRKKLYIWLIRSTMNNTKNNDLSMQCVWFGCLRTLDVTQHCNAMQCTIECTLKKHLRERMRLVAIIFHVCISTTTDNDGHDGRLWFSIFNSFLGVCDFKIWLFVGALRLPHDLVAGSFDQLTFDGQKLTVRSFRHFPCTEDTQNQRTGKWAWNFNLVAELRSNEIIYLFVRRSFACSLAAWLVCLFFVYFTHGKCALARSLAHTYTHTYTHQKIHNWHSWQLSKSYEWFD